MQQKTPKILHSAEEIRHVVCTLKMTLNKYDDTYVLLLNYKKSPLTLIRISDIYSLFDSESKGTISFIPNVDGVLCKTTKASEEPSKILNPTMLWMSWEKIPKFIEFGKLLEYEYINGQSKDDNDKDPNKRFYNEKFLIFRQSHLIHWKMNEEAIKFLNKTAYDIFKTNFGDKAQWGPNHDRLPTISDFVEYLQNVGTHLNASLTLPSYMTILVSINKIKEYLPTLNYDLNLIHPSIKHLFVTNGNNTTTDKPEKPKRIYQKSAKSKE